MEGKKKILWIGDGVVPTGFSTVNHNIIAGLSKEAFEVHHLAINYFGDPHNFEHKVYPALSPAGFQFGDVYGYTRLPQLLSAIKPDIIFILNDIWVIDSYLEHIKNYYESTKETLPKIVVYFPVDGKGYYFGWFRHFDVVTKMVVYTEFGKEQVLEVVPERAKMLEVIPHGTNLKDFYEIEDKQGLRQQIYASIPELWEDDSFIVLNANRNQPRKRLDLSLRAFALFSAGKPKNVRYYHHAGTKDAGWDLYAILERLGRELKAKGLATEGTPELHERIILTNDENQLQHVPISKLNDIYNVTDVGINTSLGEGWGLISTEHAVTGAAQIVPEHTACKELFEDCGLVTPIKLAVKDIDHLLDREFVDVEILAEQLELLYQDRDLLKSLSIKGKEKFTQEKYQWDKIAKIWNNLFLSLG